MKFKIELDELESAFLLVSKYHNRKYDIGHREDGIMIIISKDYFIVNHKQKLKFACNKLYDLVIKLIKVEPFFEQRIKNLLFDDMNPFSFFNKIFGNDNLYNDEEDYYSHLLSKLMNIIADVKVTKIKYHDNLEKYLKEE